VRGTIVAARSIQSPASMPKSDALWPDQHRAAPDSLDAEGYRVVNWDPDYTPMGGLCPRMTGIRPAFLKAHPELPGKLLEVDALAAAAVDKNPKLALDAIMKRLGLPEAIAKAALGSVPKALES
jgi:ABC-type nitrate/sulfonate/bicarbonate transport system substrate-binding protein